MLQGGLSGRGTHGHRGAHHVRQRVSAVEGHQAGLRHRGVGRAVGQFLVPSRGVAAEAASGRVLAARRAASPVPAARAGRILQEVLRYRVGPLVLVPAHFRAASVAQLPLGVRPVPLVVDRGEDQNVEHEQSAAYGDGHAQGGAVVTQALTVLPVVRGVDHVVSALPGRQGRIVAANVRP